MPVPDLKSAGANVWRLVLAGLIVLPAAVTASLDGSLGENPIGYGAQGGDLSSDPMPQLPGATLPRATLPGAVDTSECGAYHDTATAVCSVTEYAV